jgi:rod shape-determining protein MreD
VAPSRIGLTVALLMTAVVLQVSVAARLGLPGATPDVVLLVVVGLALAYGPTWGVAVGFTGGLLLDVAPPGLAPMGRWAIVLCLVGYLSGLLADQVERSALLPFVTVAVAAAGASLAYAAIGGLIGDGRVTWPAVSRVVPTAVLYDVVLTPFVVFAVLALARRGSADVVTTARGRR